MNAGIWCLNDLPSAIINIFFSIDLLFQIRYSSIYMYGCGYCIGRLGRLCCRQTWNIVVSGVLDQEIFACFKDNKGKTEETLHPTIDAQVCLSLCEDYVSSCARQTTRFKCYKQVIVWFNLNIKLFWCKKRVFSYINDHLKFSSFFLGLKISVMYILFSIRYLT